LLGVARISLPTGRNLFASISEQKLKIFHNRDEGIEGKVKMFLVMKFLSRPSEVKKTRSMQRPPRWMLRRPQRMKRRLIGRMLMVEVTW